MNHSRSTCALFNVCAKECNTSLCACDEAINSLRALQDLGKRGPP